VRLTLLGATKSAHSKRPRVILVASASREAPFSVCRHFGRLRHSPARNSIDLMDFPGVDFRDGFGQEAARWLIDLIHALAALMD
jgi:hypothetical protein